MQMKNSTAALLLLVINGIIKSSKKPLNLFLILFNIHNNNKSYNI